MVASCPISFLHASGRDNNPSFAIGINPSGASGYRCYSCHIKGWVGFLIRQIERRSGEKLPTSLHDLVQKDGDLTPEQMQERLTSMEFWVPTTTQGGVTVRARTRVAEEQPHIEILPETALDPFRSHTLESALYLRGPARKLSQESIERWELGWDARSCRITIPIRDNDRQLLGIAKRLHPLYQDPENGPKYLNTKGFKRDYVLFGEHLLTSSRQGYVVEGYFNVIWMHQNGYRNVVALMGSYPSYVQVKKLKKWFDFITVVADGDVAGKKMAEELRRALEPDVKVNIQGCPPGRDANDLSSAELSDLVGIPGVTKMLDSD